MFKLRLVVGPELSHGLSRIAAEPPAQDHDNEQTHCHIG